MQSRNNLKGLNEAQVDASRQQHGINKTGYKESNPFFHALLDMIKEPMFVLLLVAATIYFISGNTGEGLFMVFSILLVSAISLYQDSRSRNALKALQKLAQPKAKVLREGSAIDIAAEEVVIGDYLVVEEGEIIPADAVVLEANDFAVNESILTGESFPVDKKEATKDPIYQGTFVTGGLAIAEVTAIGNGTKLGQIAGSLASIEEEKTPLQVQMSNFVRKMAVAGLIVFLIVWGLNYMQSQELLNSLLKALTLAMSILPEEIPVAFTSFMALGAWRLMRQGIIVKQTKTVETLGSASVICTDKTGTITRNQMSLAKFYLGKQKRIAADAGEDEEANRLLTLSMWASEPIPFDPMEHAIHDAYARLPGTDKRNEFRIVHEYPLSGTPPMMTHVFANDAGDRVIAAKGAPEAIISISDLSPAEKQEGLNAFRQLASEGYRVLAVAESDFKGEDYPGQQQDLPFNFRGLVAFYDPPKENIADVFQKFYQAGIDIKIITGDNAATTSTIARQLNFRGSGDVITGEELSRLSSRELDEQVMRSHVLTRMFPEAKLQVIESLKSNRQIVAMTGDGVNDGPALKAAHIGIAMGERGSEIARDAASLIIADDDLGKMVDAVAMGRKIYSNLKKAIQYIVSIHIPIILTVFIPLALGWVYPNIFTPVHVIFLELIMGPTCSIIYENEPLEKNLMKQPPRPLTDTFFNWRELGASIVQGLVITAGTLGSYLYAVHEGLDENGTRTMVFITLITANIFLTLVNRSFTYSIFVTIRYKNRLVPLMIGITILLTVLLVFVPPFARFFQFELLTMPLLLIATAFGALSVLWKEVGKTSGDRR